ncbi:MAG: 1-deoxy-D-xylulose-5-phosphate reductoisomerase [Thermodesulfobacteria bacterium]|nr:1-deoxy-D-xylulose-5-phosphate reductoisomerase [Thermodesulfobacteriota bacterium]
MNDVKRIVVLGSTGSIGKSVADIVRKSQGRLEIVGLGAGRNIELLAKQIEEFRPRKVAVMSKELAQELEPMVSGRDVKILWSKEGYNELASMASADLVVSSMVGAAGLIPTVTAIEAGKDVALANKETLVAAGPLVMRLVEEHRVNLLPIDSEHSAIFQCLQGYRDSMIKRIILTASGGPFRNKAREELENITPEEAIAHPNWSMGAKISVDSSTLMNKGLEVIEARWLFGVEPEKIDVVVHPQSIVHSMVEYIDGSVIAQLGIPDMRVPISYALYWPDRMELDLPSLDLVNCGPLTFEAPQMDKFPCLGLAFEALKMGGTATTVLNAANEVAVEAFLTGRIPYLKIPEVISKVLHDVGGQEMASLDDVLRADALARLKAQEEAGLLD